MDRSISFFITCILEYCSCVVFLFIFESRCLSFNCKRNKTRRDDRRPYQSINQWVHTMRSKLHTIGGRRQTTDDHPLFQVEPLYVGFGLLSFVGVSIFLFCWRRFQFSLKLPVFQLRFNGRDVSIYNFIRKYTNLTWRVSANWNDTFEIINQIQFVRLQFTMNEATAHIWIACYMYIFYVSYIFIVGSVGFKALFVVCYPIHNNMCKVHSARTHSATLQRITLFEMRKTETRKIWTLTTNEKRELNKNIIHFCYFIVSIYWERTFFIVALLILSLLFLSHRSIF